MITWFNLSKLPVGAKLVLVNSMTVNAQMVPVTIPAGTIVSIVEQGLNEIWSGLIVRVHDTRVAAALHYFQDEYDGTIIIAGPDPCDEPAWQKASPFNGEPRRARFWTYTNKGLVRIALRKGKALHHVEGGPDDEGYSYTSTTYSFDGDNVVVESHTRACDCDGPIERGHAIYARLRELAVIRNEDDTHSFPHWQELQAGWQRDTFAEQAGY
jgi:hypothetical protein